ncbi:MAG TPA: hypothetical protein VMR99_01085 [Candidatus Paceibacterota bacterium]|nr:hypothetical protein [Candidatus Paceibacterota bacterium]
MAGARRSSENPILIPDTAFPWQAEATFNPSVVEGRDGKVHMLFRAMGAKTNVDGAEVEISSIGHAVGKTPAQFGERNQLVAPTEPWERYGCEDPRVTEFEGRYYIFYTAVSDFSADGIKVAVAITKDFKTIEERHLVTPFNAKAMALFPERVGGKIAALITVNTDRPPAKICVALFDTVEDIWSKEYWDEWYKHFGDHEIAIEQNEKDQIEVGSAPQKTKDGWLIFYSYIYNYFSPPPIFGIQAALLDLNDPQKIVGEVKRPFIVPQEEYEFYGRVPRVVFPSGALIKGPDVHLYYGAADTTSCMATFKKKELLEQLVFTAARQLRRFEGNPIITPIAEHPWESQATFNPAAIYEGGKVHILYRAMSGDNTSVIGYALSPDGVDVTERLPEPIYTPSADFEQKKNSGGNSGCEDPRITKIGNRIYMCYTAFDGNDPPRVALTSIDAKDFVDHQWKWTKPILISPPGADDKDAAVFPKKIGEKYIFLHRLGSEIWIDCVDDLDFKNGKFLGGSVLMRPRDTAWDSKRIGIAAPPIETRYGWLLLYHGISKRTGHYSVRAALLDKDDPSKILYRTHDPLLEPTPAYEREGIVSDVVFPCGAVVLRHQLFVYYGGADKVVGVASIDIDFLIEGLVKEAAAGSY